MRRTRAKAALLAATIVTALSFDASSARAEAPALCEQEMAHAASASGIPLGVLYAVALTETGARSKFNPFDLDIDGRALHPHSIPEALATIAQERAHGAKFVDIGCMQINYEWHGKDFGSIEQMFDPRTNVRYAANFLKQLEAREGTWTLAVARYNAGPNNNAAQKKYVCSVIRNMISVGMAAWTPTARSFCA
jgi:hypothetical protein